MITSPLNLSNIFSSARLFGYCCVRVVPGVKKYLPVTVIPVRSDFTPLKIPLKYSVILFITYLYSCYYQCHPFSTRNAISSRLKIFIGRRYFHSSVRSWSILNLGNVHLSHIIRKTTPNVFPMYHRNGGM